jgi:CarD family transcriptional regulator
MAKPSKTVFTVGEAVVYPAHGLGILEDIGINSVNGTVIEMYVVSFAHENLTVRVPKKTAVRNGLRQVSEVAAVTKALQTLRTRPKSSKIIWYRREAAYNQKIHSGDLIALAEVVRDVHPDARTEKSSWSEDKLYEKAWARLLREVSHVLQTDLEATVVHITQQTKKQFTLPGLQTLALKPLDGVVASPLHVSADSSSSLRSGSVAKAQPLQITIASPPENTVAPPRPTAAAPPLVRQTPRPAATKAAGVRKKRTPAPTPQKKPAAATPPTGRRVGPKPGPTTTEADGVKKPRATAQVPPAKPAAATPPPERKVVQPKAAVAAPPVVKPPPPPAATEVDRVASAQARNRELEAAAKEALRAIEAKVAAKKGKKYRR